MMRVLTWVLRAIVFLALFGLALNNRQEVVMNGFFGTHWQAPLMLMCLVFFAAGCALGALSVLWRQWRHATPTASPQPTQAAATMPPSSTYGNTGLPSQLGVEATVGTPPR